MPPVEQFAARTKLRTIKAVRRRTLPALLVLLFCGTACATAAPSSSAVTSSPPTSPSSTTQHTWPDAAWHPYGPTSPFNWTVPANPPIVTNSAQIVDSLLALSGCVVGDSTTHSRCKPNNSTAFDDHASGGGWPTYYLLPTDPDVTITCTGAPCPLQTLTALPPSLESSSAS